MGKRELLLISGFLIVGTLVYYVTAPASAQTGQGFSFSKLVEHIRREVRGNRSSAELKTTTKLPLKTGVTEVRFETASAPLTIVGEDRSDILCELIVWSSGYDESEAKKYAAATALKPIETGSVLVISIDYPPQATQRASLVARVPRDIALRVQSRGKLELSDVASAEIGESRGQVTIRRVSGRLAVTHRGGQLEIESVGSLKLNARGSSAAISDIKNDISIQFQAGELHGKGIGGAIDIESNGTRVTFEDLSTTRKPIRINAVNGTVALAGIVSETRIEGRDTRVEIKVDRPVPVTVNLEGDETLEVMLPPGGFELDAIASAANVTLPSGFPGVKASGDEHRASGAVGGGGPSIALRTSRGNIVVKTRETTAP